MDAWLRLSSSSGLVREKESGFELEGLIVRAYDKALLYDDLMGEARA